MANDSSCAGIPRMLHGIAVSYTAPMARDMVWLQPVKPGLFRWMIPTPDGGWVSIAVEQPIPKNALLAYFNDKIEAIENRIDAGLYKYYTETETEGLLGAYIKNEDGDDVMGGILDFHCDDTQSGDERINFAQTVADYEKSCYSYIRQFYDRIILSIDTEGTLVTVTLNKDGLYYNDNRIINEGDLDSVAVSRIRTNAQSSSYNGKSYSFLSMTPTAYETGSVTIGASFDAGVLAGFIGDIFKDGVYSDYYTLYLYSETYSESDTVNNAGAISVKHNSVTGFVGAQGTSDCCESYNHSNWTTEYSGHAGAYPKMSSKDGASSLGNTGSIVAAPDFVRLAVECPDAGSSAGASYYYNELVLCRDCVWINNNLHVGGNVDIDGDTHIRGDLYLDGEFFIGGDPFNVGVTTFSSTATSTDGYSILTLSSSPSTGDVKLTGGIDGNALAGWIQGKLDNGDITVPEADPNDGVSRNVSLNGAVTISSDTELVTGAITGNITSVTYSGGIPEAKHETTFILQSNGSYSVTFVGSNSSYKVIDKNESYTLISGQWIEFNYLSDGSSVYIRSAGQPTE